MADVLIDSKNARYKKKEYYVTIDSRDRDRTKWPLSSCFEVKFEPASDFTGATIGRKFLNVVCIELVSAIYPNTNDVLNEMYLFLTIPEIDGMFEATNLEGTKAFAKLVPTLVQGNYVYSYSNDCDAPVKLYKTKGVRFDKMTFQFKKWNGTLFDFGQDNTPPSLPLNSVQTSVTLKVTTIEPYIR